MASDQRPVADQTNGRLRTRSAAMRAGCGDLGLVAVREAGEPRREILVTAAALSRAWDNGRLPRQIEQNPGRQGCRVLLITSGGEEIHQDRSQDARVHVVSLTLQHPQLAMRHRLAQGPGGVRHEREARVARDHQGRN